MSVGTITCQRFVGVALGMVLVEGPPSRGDTNTADQMPLNDTCTKNSTKWSGKPAVDMHSDGGGL